MTRRQLRAHGGFDEGGGLDPQGVELAEGAQLRGEVDVQEIPRGFGVGEEFPEEGVVRGVGMVRDAGRMAGSPGDVNIILLRAVVRSSVMVRFVEACEG